MTLAGDSQVRFSESEQQELAEYRPLNRFALVACVLGWIASVALIHPILCLFPLLGIIIALLALRQLGSVENRQSGRLLALVGLFLSLMFGSWGVARESSRELRLYGQARHFAESWFALLRDGRVYDAHQLTLKEPMRAASGVSLEKHYESRSRADQERMRAARESGTSHSPEDPEAMMDMMQPSAREGFEMFFKEPIAKRLRDLGGKGHYEFRNNVQIQTSGVITEQVELIFVASENSDGSLNSFSVKITLERETQGGVANWNVSRVVDPYAR